MSRRMRQAERLLMQWHCDAYAVSLYYAAQVNELELRAKLTLGMLS